MSKEADEQAGPKYDRCASATGLLISIPAGAWRSPFWGTSMRRIFTRKQRQQVFLASDGRCSICGCELPVGWHVDHVVPFSKGGQTHITNAQALCPSCNQKKSDAMPGQIEPRPFQSECIDRAISNVDRGKNSLVAVAAPGSGKTLMSQMVMNELWKRGDINGLLVLVPRLNLCEQYELDWRSDRQKLGGNVMGEILHVANNPPLFGREKSQFGAVTTYQSVISRPALYLRIARQFRLGLILDEAHQLGIEDATGEGTESARVCDELAQLASFTIVMTGTEVRSDGMRILPSVVDYTEPQKGTVYVKADVESRYRDGVEQGFLRRFEYELNDGSAWRDYMDRRNKITLSEMESGLSDVLTQPGYWQPIIDKMVKRTREVQKEVDPRMCGLVGAAGQNHAQAIIAYLKAEYPELKALLAVSKESRSQKHLRKFRQGGYDVLVTVGMAHVGYDHKPISVVCCLNAYRQYAWLFQFFARGLRVMRDVDLRTQYLRAIVPDDPSMRDFVEQMRSESEAGLKLREKRESTSSEKGEAELYDVDHGEVTATTVMGMDPNADINPDFYDRIRKPAEELAPGVPLTNIKQLIDMFGPGQRATEAVAGDVAVATAPQMTHKERLANMRNKINDEFKKIDAALMREGYTVNFGHTATECYRHFGSGIPDCKSMSELKKRAEWLQRYRTNHIT